MNLRILILMALAFAGAPPSFAQEAAPPSTAGEDEEVVVVEPRITSVAPRAGSGKGVVIDRGSTGDAAKTTSPSTATQNTHATARGQ